MGFVFVRLGSAFLVAIFGNYYWQRIFGDLAVQRSANFAMQKTYFPVWCVRKFRKKS